MNCIHCGASVSDDAKFCTNCGKILGAEESSAPIIPDANESGTASSAVSLTKPEEIISEEETAAEALHNDTAIPSDEKPSEISDSETEKEPAPFIDTQQNITAPEEITPAAEENTIDNNSYAEIPETEYSHSEILPVEEAPKKLSAGRAIGAAVIAFFAIIFLIIVNLLFSARIGLSSDVIRKSAESLSAETILDSQLNDKETVAEYIFNNMHGSFITKSNAEVKDVRSFIIKTDIIDFIAGKLESYSAYLINGTESDDPSLTAEELADFFRDNDKLITEEFGYQMKEKDYADVEKELEDAGLSKALSIEKWSDEADFNFKNTRFIFSYITIGIIFAIALVLCIWSAIVLDRHTRTIMGYIGNIAFISGLVIFIPTAAFLIAASAAALWTGSVAIYAAAKLLLPFAAIGACTGLFEIIVGIIFKKIRKYIKKKELKMNGGC